MTAKANVNYTPEMEAVMLKAYEANPTGDTVAMLAADFGKSVRSVVAKLSRMGIYKAKEYVSKTGDAPVRKETLADKLAEIAGLTEAEADSLTKANKTALAKIIAKLEG